MWPNPPVLQLGVLTRSARRKNKKKRHSLVKMMNSIVFRHSKRILTGGIHKNYHVSRVILADVPIKKGDIGEKHLSYVKTNIDSYYTV